ncbi:MAG: substrate binding domain-containing protein [Chthoniobacter sp.]
MSIPSFARLLLASRIGRFLTAHPGLHLELAIRDQIGDLLAEGFDAAVRFGEPEPSSLIARRLLQVRVVTCASPAYLAEHGRPGVPRDLAKGHECLLFRDPTTGAPFPWNFIAAKDHHRTGHGPLDRERLADSSRSLPGRLRRRANLRAGLCPHLASGQLVNLFPDWPDELFPLYAYYPSRHFLPGKVRALLDFLTASINAEAGGT